jgi:hypothetical protein
MEARIALETGDANRCEFALSKIGPISPYYSQSRTTYYCALHTGLKLLRDEPPETLAPVVDKLRQSHQLSQSLYLQDFETYWLFRGLAAVGRRGEAEEMLRNYVRIHRRCRWPLSPRLVALLESASRTEPSPVEKRGEILAMN